MLAGLLHLWGLCVIHGSTGILQWVLMEVYGSFGSYQ